MTINYLDSKRIVKLSTDTVQTLSYENTSAVSIGTGDSGTSVDLTGSTLSNSWVLRFKLTMASKANNLIFMVQDINTIDETTTRDGIGLRQTASTSYYDFEGCNGTAPTGGQYDHRFTTVPAIDTKYIQVTRISETSAKIEFCDSSYTVLESSGNITIADITNLRYFVIYNNGSALTVDDIDFWNEVSSITTKPTNVQDNSILVNKDTGRRYWFDTGNVTFEDDFTSDNWTDSDSTIIGVNTSTQVLDFKAKDGNFYEASYIPQTIGDKFVYRMRFNLSTIDQTGNVESVRVGFGLSNAGDIAFTSARDEVGITMRVSSTYNKFYAFTADGAQIPYGGTDFSLTPATSTDYYLEIIGNEGTYTFNIYSDEYVTLTESESITDAGLVLDKLVVRATTSATTNNQVQGTIDDVKLYNGVTSVTPATWTKEISSTLPTVSGLQLHLDANDASTITKDGSNLVSAWNDKSGQANHVTQATGSKQPLWVDQVQDTFPTIRFDGSNDEMAVTYGSSLSTAATVFIVCTMPTASGGERMVFDGLTSGGRFAYLKSSGNIHYMYRGNGVSSTTVDKTMRMFTLVWNGSSSSLGIDGTDVTTGNVGTQSPTGLRLGAQYNSANFGDTDICEILIYGSALSTADRTSIENYLSNKWSTP